MIDSVELAKCMDIQFFLHQRLYAMRRETWRRIARVRFVTMLIL